MAGRQSPKYTVVDLETGETIHVTGAKPEAMRKVKGHPERGILYRGRYLRIGLDKNHPDYQG